MWTAKTDQTGWMPSGFVMSRLIYDYGNIKGQLYVFSTVFSCFILAMLLMCHGFCRSVFLSIFHIILHLYINTDKFSTGNYCWVLYIFVKRQGKLLHFLHQTTLWIKVNRHLFLEINIQANLPYPTLDFVYRHILRVPTKISITVHSFNRHI